LLTLSLAAVDPKQTSAGWAILTFRRWLRGLAGTFDEALGHGNEGPVFQRHNENRPRRVGQLLDSKWVYVFCGREVLAALLHDLDRGYFGD
jgi:hypothetical protein